uniref:Uncharacterized protein n=1 Tax=Anguilla anguilla TaxID=7936 RepID=A0A0E9WQV3_ANGAN
MDTPFLYYSRYYIGQVFPCYSLVVHSYHLNPFRRGY